jgi:hypothetical protein
MVVAVAIAVPSGAAAQSISLTLDAGLDVGVTTAIAIARSATGVPVAVTLSTTSAQGAFSLDRDPFGTWGTALSVPLAASAAATTVYYRDSIVASVTLTAMAGGYAPGVLSAGVSTHGFHDDFESGGLLYTDVPEGRWNSLTAFPNVAGATTAAAAHTGSLGMRLTDNDPTAGPHNSTEYDYVMQPISGTGYARGWVRLVSDSGVGEVEVFTLEASGGNQPPLVGLDVTLPGWALALDGEDVSGDCSTTTSATVDAGWHLVELEVTGTGGADAGYRAWVDRHLIVSRRCDWSTAAWGLGALTVGEPWTQDGRYTGAVDFDDVAVSTVPPPSTLEVGCAPIIELGTCVPATLTLYDSPSHALAAAQLPVVAHVAAGSTALQTFSDALCMVPAVDVVVPEGASSNTFYVRGTATGAAVVGARDDDLFTVAAAVTVIGSDAGGSTGGSGDGGHAPVAMYPVGCGCNASSPAFVLMLLQVLFWRRRRRTLPPRTARASARTGCGSS